MNKVILIGRLTRDPEIRVTPSGISCCTFTVACDRRFADQNGNRQADFLNCVAWRERAEFVAKYFAKGRRISKELRRTDLCRRSCGSFIFCLS